MDMGGETQLGKECDTRRGGAPGSGGEGAVGGKADLNRREAAEYLAGLLDGLRSVADGAGLTFIAYLLAMALEEAQAEKAREDQAG